jgi:hypothetical protein
MSHPEKYGFIRGRDAAGFAVPAWDGDGIAEVVKKHILSNWSNLFRAVPSGFRYVPFRNAVSAPALSSLAAGVAQAAICATSDKSDPNPRCFPCLSPL